MVKLICFFAYLTALHISHFFFLVKQNEALSTHNVVKTEPSSFRPIICNTTSVRFAYSGHTPQGIKKVSVRQKCFRHFRGTQFFETSYLCHENYVNTTSCPHPQSIPTFTNFSKLKRKKFVQIGDFDWIF